MQPIKCVTEKEERLDIMKFRFKRELYSKTALLKAAYNYTDKAYVHLDADEDYYYVNIEMKDMGNSVSEKEFSNEMLAQSVRHEIYLQTKNIRELMLARALATSVVTNPGVLQESGDVPDQYCENEILKDWFLEK